MPVVALHCTEELAREMFRLEGVNGRIVGAHVEDRGGHRRLVLDVETPDAPEGATGMNPVYQQDHETGRVTMLNPGWTTEER